MQFRTAHDFGHWAKCREYSIVRRHIGPTSIVRRGSSGRFLDFLDLARGVINIFPLRSPLRKFFEKLFGSNKRPRGTLLRTKRKGNMRLFKFKRGFATVVGIVTRGKHFNFSATERWMFYDWDIRRCTALRFVMATVVIVPLVHVANGADGKCSVKYGAERRNIAKTSRVKGKMRSVLLIDDERRVFWFRAKPGVKCNFATMFVIIYDFRRHSSCQKSDPVGTLSEVFFDKIKRKIVRTKNTEPTAEYRLLKNRALSMDSLNVE